MDKDIAIKVENLSKTFRIPHEKVSSLRGAFVGMFKGKRTYEEFQALDDVSFEVKKGEFFGIIGRNGSGKSTLLKILAGIYQPDRGKVTIDGMISPFLELGIGFNPELSGRDNIYLNATVLGLTRKQIDEKFDDIVKFSELERFIDQKLKNYSSGMQVRLAFSVSIHANRDILLMDEVLAVGDANFQRKCLREFHKYKTLNKTVVLVSHDISVIQQYCDRALLLNKGTVVGVGESEKMGDIYISQNIFDEENRKHVSNELSRNDNHAKEDEKKAVEIISVDFVDSNGIKKSTFETGGQLKIVIKFKIYDKAIDEINFGIGMHLEGGGYAFGYNTQMDNCSVDKSKDEISLCFDSVPLLKGDYFINVVCFGYAETAHYDFKPHYKTLSIFSKGAKGRYRGMIDISHEWV